MRIIFKGGPGSGFHNHAGRPGKVGGSASSNYLPAEQRIWQGAAHDQKSNLTNKQTGAIGEYLAAKALEDKYGVPFSTLNQGRNNAPIDLAGDHTAVEVKAGPASNGPTAQHWRATSSTPGKAEQELLRQMSKEEKRAHHDFKRQQVLDRKYAMLDEMSKIAGTEVKPMTVAAILSPDGTRGDVFMIPDFHQRLPWKQYATEEYYVGTYDVPIEQFKERTVLRFKGGSGSGHWGHAGRPPVEGGSIPGLLMSNTFVNPDYFRVGPGKKLFQDMEDPENVERLITTIELAGSVRNNHLTGLSLISDKPDGVPFKFTQDYVESNPSYSQFIGSDVNGWYNRSEKSIRLNPDNITMSHTFAHELGHHVTLNTPMSAPYKNALGRAFLAVNEKDKSSPLTPDMLNQVGLRRYSMTNVAEFMADSYKVYLFGSKSQRNNFNSMLRASGSNHTIDDIFGG